MVYACRRPMAAAYVPTKIPACRRHAHYHPPSPGLCRPATGRVKGAPRSATLSHPRPSSASSLPYVLDCGSSIMLFPQARIQHQPIVLSYTTIYYHAHDSHSCHFIRCEVSISCARIAWVLWNACCHRRADVRDTAPSVPYTPGTTRGVRSLRRDVEDACRSDPALSSRFSIIAQG